MAPRSRRARAALPEPTAGRSTLIRCFLWELAQALKESYYMHSSYNTRQKHTFTINYAKHVPLRALQLAALEAFAPPTQRVMSQLRQIFARHDIPDELAGLVLKALQLPAASLDDVCSKVAPWFIGELQEVAGKLTVVLPKDGDKVSKDKNTNTLVHAFDNYRQGFWRQYVHWDVDGASPTKRQWTVDDVHWPLARRIMAAERGLTPTTISEHLGLPRIPEKDEPHSLELLIRLIKRGGNRYHKSDTRSVVATMVVPHDVSCCDLLGWMHELDDSLESYCYLNVRHQGMEMLHNSRDALRPPGGVGLLFDTYVHGAGGPTEEEAALPFSLCVRVWRIETAHCDYAYDSESEDDVPTPSVDPAGFRKCEVLGSRVALMHKAIARVQADEDLFEGDRPYQAEEGGGSPKHIDVKFHTAVADVLPLPEDVRPTMEEYAANPARYSCSGSSSWVAEMEWNHSENEYEASAVRRLPRLRDEQYPAITKIRSVPHTYL
jgi:hypothetical protein